MIRETCPFWKQSGCWQLPGVHGNVPEQCTGHSGTEPSATARGQTLVCCHRSYARANSNSWIGLPLPADPIKAPAAVCLQHVSITGDSSNCIALEASTKSVSRHTAMICNAPIKVWPCRRSRQPEIVAVEGGRHSSRSSEGKLDLQLIYADATQQLWETLLSCTARLTWPTGIGKAKIHSCLTGDCPLSLTKSGPGRFATDICRSCV